MKDLDPKTLVFDVGAGDGLEIVGVAMIDVVIVGGKARLKVTRPRSLRVVPHRRPHPVPAAQEHDAA